MSYVTNAHTHLELTTLARLCPKHPTAFLPWLTRVGWEIRHLARDEILSGIAQGIAELKACGTTHVGDITHTWLSVEPLLASGLRGVVYLEVLGLERKRALERLREAQSAIDTVRRHPDYGAMQVGLSLHAPYSCHPDLLRVGAQWCRAEEVPLCIHVAESRFEVEWLLHRELSGARRVFAPLIPALGMMPARVPRQRPLAYLAALGVLEARPLLVHAVHVTQAEIALIAAARCAVVHCPRSNHLLGCGRMPLENYLAAGVTVYLGTDSRASSPDLSIHAEAQFACQLHRGHVPEQQILALVHRPLEHPL
ncbi:MAG: amidohydrolase family protein [Anaerolineae bacterium]|nr:amidohydrolase family protein [Anaerolineae bacterium]MDW8071228.1 amidohydrolase family protein [Anaerolineae bacterium]